MEWISIDKDLPEHEQEASVDVIWAVVCGDKIEAWGRGNIGTDGEWYKDCKSLSWIPTHWAFLLPPPSSQQIKGILTNPQINLKIDFVYSQNVV